MRKGPLVVMICLLGLVVFAGLVIYGWDRRFGPIEGVEPQPFPTLSVPFVARSVELGPDTGPGDAVWKDLPGIQASLMHQVMERPWPRGHTPTVSVQSFHDGKDIYFRLSWADDQADTVIAPGKFTDGCAVALPLDAGTPPRSIMMGFSSLVSFWHWRADVDAEFWHGKSPNRFAHSDHHNPFEKTEVDPTIITKVESAVTDLLASRPGSLTRKEHQLVQGAGVWADGVWAVVFKRALTTDHADTDGQLKPGKWIVLLYRHDCPDCHRVMPQYVRLARKLAGQPDAPRIALVEVPPYGGASLGRSRGPVSAWSAGDRERLVRADAQFDVRAGR